MGRYGFTIKIIIIVLTAFLFIGAWSEVIIRSMTEYFGWNKEEISTYVKLGIIWTIILAMVVIGFNVELHEFFGISETVDVELTGTKERIGKGGQVRHYNF
jgi:hypothetical protein